MQHLFPGDAEDHPSPPLDRSKLTGPHSWTRRALEAKRRVQVFAHQAMLKLGSQGQKIGQLLAVPHHDGRLTPHGRKVSAAIAVLNGADHYTCRTDQPDLRHHEPTRPALGSRAERQISHSNRANSPPVT
jgi:hypothetical protein